MLKLSLISPATAAEDEVAALMAAVVLYVESNAQDCTVRGAEEIAHSANSWKLASLLEGTGRSGRLTTPLASPIRKNAWKASQLPKIFVWIVPIVLTINAMTCTGACAQHSLRPAPNTVTDNSQSMPPLAPPPAHADEQRALQRGERSSLPRGEQSALSSDARSALSSDPRSALSSGERSALSSGERSALSSGERSTFSSGAQWALSSGERSTLSSGAQSALSSGEQSALSNGQQSTPSSGAQSAVSSGAQSAVSGGAFNRQDLGIRVGLALDVNSADIGLPDGASLRDGTTGNTLAELPAQSHWQLALRSPGVSSRLNFAGRLDNVAHSQVLIASRNHYRNVAFVSGVAPTNVELIPLPVSNQPQFWLPGQVTSESGAVEGRSYVLVPPTGGTFAVNGKLYRGSLMIRTKTPISSGDNCSTQSTANAIANSQAHMGKAARSASVPSQVERTGFHLINYVDLEDYLLSVVPGEMPASWPLEALKAQAIVARSFAMARVGGHEADGYDVKPTTVDQVYNGIVSENSRSNRAVSETAGEVIKHHGNVVTAFFHSASGGCTEVSENVWSRPLPYLKAVPDYDDDSPHFSWSRVFSVPDAQKALATNGKSVGTLLALVPVARGVSPRVRWLMAVGTSGTVFVSGELARKAFALPSSSFNVAGVAGSYTFAGRGFGHGLGMSQWGSKKLAEAGYTAGHILTYYYKDITVERF
jgi:SpoIID/LytB domain protein